MTICLTLHDVTKSFSTNHLYLNLSYSFQHGCYAITGKNGVGKTVLLEMLAGAMPPDAGEIFLSDTGSSSSIRYKKKLAFIPGKPDFYPFSTGRQFLNFIASVNCVSPHDVQHHELISDFHLQPHMNTTFADMSLGTQKKLFLSTLTIGQKSLFILDEPTNGLDVEACSRTAHLLAKLSQHAIVILATHDQTLLKALNPTIIHLDTIPITYFHRRQQYASEIL